MTTRLKTYKVAALPAAPEADAIYYTPSGTDGLNVTVMNNDGTQGYTTMTPSDVEAIVDDHIAIHEDIYQVATMTDMENHVKHSHDMVFLVLDASGHDEVIGGAAMFVYSATTAEYGLVSSYNSLNVQWDEVGNKPTSTVGSIDAMTQVFHEHGAALTDIDAVANGLVANTTELSGISANGNNDAVQNGKILANDTYTSVEW